MFQMTAIPAESVDQIWKHACQLLQQNLSPMAYNTWIISNPLTELRLVGEDRAIGVISSPTAFHSTNVEKNFYAQIKEVLDQILQRNLELQFRVGQSISTAQSTPQPAFSEQTLTDQQITSSVSEEVVSASPTPPLVQPMSGTLSSIQERLRTLATAPQRTPTQSLPTQSAFPTFSSSSSATQDSSSQDLFSLNNVQSISIDRARLQAQKAGLRLDYTFDTFAVSTTNELAHAAALAVSSQPGLAYNPLFIYGGVGVGKTHLMHAVGNNILKNNPESKILYCTGEDFTNEIVNAIQTKKAMQFKEKFRTVDVLLIDDVQFIAGKNTIQEEFFHTFNTITKRAGQIILTSDRPPHEIALLEDRLRSRFEAGLMVDIQQPSFELRTAILLIKANTYHLGIPMNLAQMIASKVESARKIEGIIKILKSKVELEQREITPELIEEIFQRENTKSRSKLRVKPHEVIKAVSEYYQIKPITLKGPQRLKAIVRARHIAMYLMKEELNLPYVEIGRWFSNRDHTSAMHAVEKIHSELRTEEDLMQDLREISTVLRKISR